MLKKIIFLILMLTSYWLQLSAQETFNKRSRFNLPTAVFTSVVSTDSAYYVTGLTADTLPPYKIGNIFIKFDLEGNVEDIKTITSTTETYEAWNANLINLEDGSFIVNGYYTDSLMQALIIKYDAFGNMEWTKQYPNFFGAQNIVASTWMTPTGNNGYMVCNRERNLSNNGEIVLMRIDSIGEIIWRKKYGSNLNEWPYCILALNDNEYVIGGKNNDVTHGGSNYSAQTILFAVDSTGQVLWQYFSSDERLQDGAHSILPAPDGGLVIASGLGEEVVYAGGISGLLWKSGYVFKLDSTRNIEWEVEFKEPRRLLDNKFNKIIAVSDGSGYLVAGQMYKYYGNFQGDIFGWLAKISPEGDSLWSRKLFYYELPDSVKYHHMIYDLEETSDGGYIMVGSSKDIEADSFPQQGWLIKVDSFGCLVPGCQDIVNGVEDAETKAAQLLLYPNPAADILNVFCRPLRRVGRAEFRIIDSSGRILAHYTAHPDEGTYMFPVSNLVPGLYFLSYVFDGGAQTISFVKR